MYNCDLFYALTDDERSAGLGAILCGNQVEFLEAKKINKEKTKLQKLIHSNKNNAEIRNEFINGIIFENIHQMIESYVKDERLPKALVIISKQPNGLEILLKGFFKKVLNFVLTDQLIDEINSLTKVSYSNFNLDIVYDRVSKIQYFVHEKVQSINGKGSHYSLDANEIKNLLSATRLHLNIYDLKNKSIDSIIDMVRKTNYKMDQEYKLPSDPIFIYPYAKYIPIWKAWKMKPLINFSYMGRDEIKRLNKLFNIDTNMPKKEFEKAMLKI